MLSDALDFSRSDFSMNDFRMSAEYGFIRGRELEGTFPGDKATGTWPITGQRISYGWGYLPEELAPEGSDWPPELPADADLIAKRYRHDWPYRRLRTIAQCKAVGMPFGVSLDITDKWANPWHGQIPGPSASDIILPTMHALLIVSFNPDRDEFKFVNSWGRSWGDGGYGYIRAQRLAATWSEGWLTIPTPPEMTPLHGVLPYMRTGALRQSDGSILHWLDIVGENDERLGWASTIQSPTNFEIEELFVRPAYRRAGWGKKMFETIGRMAKDCGVPLKMWISFADTAPENLKHIEKIVSPSGLSIQASGVRWARLVAIPPSDRTAGPIPTFPYPEIPPSGHNELVQLARDVAIGLGTGVASTFIAEALKSWLKPQSGERITAKVGGIELSTSAVSAEEFRKLLKALKNVQKETEIRTKILEAGIKITVVGENPSVDGQ
jgi:GNAT superfamily N-acetyltransferase